jgi:hypothetical protein
MNLHDAATEGAVMRTRVFIREKEEWDGPDAFIALTGEYGSPKRVSITTLDLKLVLDRLATLELAVRNARDALGSVELEH